MLLQVALAAAHSGGEIPDVAGHPAGVPGHRRQNLAADQLHQHRGLDVYNLVVVFGHDFPAGGALLRGKNAEALQKLPVFRVLQGLQGLDRVPNHRQAPALGLLDPLLAVVIAVEDHAAVAPEGLPNHPLDRGLGEALLLEVDGKGVEAIRQNGVEDGVGQGDGLGGAHHPEFKLVAGKGKGAGTVAVAVVRHQLRAGGNTDVQAVALVVLPNLLPGGLAQGVQQGIPQKDGDNGRGRLVAPQAAVVAGGGGGKAQQLRVGIHPPQKGAEGEEEPDIPRRLLAGGEEVHPCVGGEGIVIVLAAAVDTGKGLFVEEAGQPLLLGHLPQGFHHQLVVVAGHVAAFVHRGQLVLGGGNLVVLGLYRDAQLPKAAVHLPHKAGDAQANATQVVVLQLLPLGHGGALEGDAAELQVQPLLVGGPVHNEILLLRPHAGLHPVHVLHADGPAEAHRFPAHRLHGAQEGGLGVQGLSGVGAEGGGDIEGVVLHKGGAGGVPGGVAPGLEGGPQPPGGEGGGVRLPHKEGFPGKLGNGPALSVGGEEGVQFAGGDAGHRLEPVGEVGGTLPHGPGLHGVRNRLGDVRVQPSPQVGGLFQPLPHIAGELLLHNPRAEHLAAKALLWIHMVPLLL